MNDPRKPIFQEVKLKGNQLLDKVREIVDEGNARRIIIKNGERTLLEFPLAVGVGGGVAALLIAPQLAAIGAIAALLTDVEVIVERDADGDGTFDEQTHLMGGRKAAEKSTAGAKPSDGPTPPPPPPKAGGADKTMGGEGPKASGGNTGGGAAGGGVGEL